MCFCTSTIWVTKQTSLGCIIPASNISLTLEFTKAHWSGLYDLGGIFVQNVVPSGMLSLWTALGIILTSYIDSTKQSAYSLSSSWIIWHCSCVTSCPIVTSWMIFMTRSFFVWVIFSCEYWLWVWVRVKGINGHEADWDCDFISTGSGVLIRGNVWGFPQGGIHFWRAPDDNIVLFYVTNGYHFYDKNQSIACSTSCIMLSGLMRYRIS